VLSRDEIQAMEDAAVTERDKLIVRLLADTGIRVGELVRLPLNDLIKRTEPIPLGLAARPASGWCPYRVSTGAPVAITEH